MMAGDGYPKCNDSVGSEPFCWSDSPSLSYGPCFFLGGFCVIGFPGNWMVELEQKVPNRRSQ